MAKNLILFGLRLLLLNVIAVILALIFITIESMVVQYIIEGLLAVVLFIFVWSDAANKGFDHVKRDKNIQKSIEADKAATVPPGKTYVPWFGFAAGLVSQLPLIVLIVLYFFFSGNTQQVLLVLINFCNYNYLYLSEALKPAFPFVYLAASAVFVLMAGLGYLNGPAKQRRLETIIERNKSKKAKRVQDEIKQNQKRKGPRKPDIRRE
jgi:hypothetical protein